MNKIKNIILALLIVFSTSTSVFAKSKIKVISTIFPMYDWTREIIGNQKETNNNIDLTLLIGNGVDLHSYQPSIQDVAKISTADIFIYVGGESDAWVDDALKNKKNKDMLILNLMNILGDSVKEEEIIEGMEAEEECEDEDEEEIEYDEHVWLSLKNAKVICKAITDALCKKDNANATVYKKNLSAYTTQLDQLDAACSAAVKSSSKMPYTVGPEPLISAAFAPSSCIFPQIAEISGQSSSVTLCIAFFILLKSKSKSLFAIAVKTACVSGWKILSAVSILL